MAEQKEDFDLERWVAALQEAILEREREMFSDKVRAEAREPHNMGVLDPADGYGLAFGSCGDTMECFVTLDGECVKDAFFNTDGCGPTVACGSMMTKLAEGKVLAEASAIEAAEVIVALDGLPPEHVHCATLAVNSLQLAIADCQVIPHRGE